MIFVTGTDTGCGKTTVGRAILAALRARGLELGVVKPVETGCDLDALGERHPEDAVALACAAGLDGPARKVCPYPLPLPASPERAAAAAGVTIEPAVIEATFAEARKGADFVLVEGAGGLLVPFTGSMMTPDLAALLGLPLLVVARDALGTVNHTLLTVETARARGIPVAGVVLTRVSDEDQAELRNAEAIARHGRVKILGTLPFSSGADDETLGQRGEVTLDIDWILEIGRGE